MKPILKQIAQANANGWRITPRLIRFLLADSQNNARIPDEIEWGALIVELLGTMTDYTRSGSFHSSQLSNCQRSQVFGYLNLPPKDGGHSPELINIFNDGTWRHARWQLVMLKARIITEVEVPVEVPGYRFTGSIDGLNRAEDWGLEIKGTSQFDQVVAFGALNHHVRQVQGYMLGMPGIDEFIIFYEDKSTNRWHEVVVPRDAYHQKTLTQILEKLNEAVEAKRLPPVLEECEFGKGAYKECSYAYACKQIKYRDAEAAGTGCSTSEEVIVKLKLKRRNTHRTSAHSEGTAIKNIQDWAGAPRPQSATGRTLRVRGRLDGTPRKPG